MTPSTNHRQPDFDQFNLDVCFGRAGGKVIWQPRILAWYADKIFAGEELPAPYQGMTLAQLYRALGCSNRVIAVINASPIRLVNFGDNLHGSTTTPELFDHTDSAQTLIDCARKCLDLFAPRLILGVSDEVSSHGDIERVRLVGQVVDEYNAAVNPGCDL